MRCITLALVLSGTLATVLRAQRVPGRDLLEFPIGSLAEAPALSLEIGDGFRNPAAVALGEKIRGRVTVASLVTGSVQGMSAQLLSGSIALPERTTGTLSIVRAAVDDIARTETDPQSIGRNVPYNTIVLSAVAARRHNHRVTSGLALRYRTGDLDQRTARAIGVDGGVIVDRLPADARVGLSSFLWRPGNGGADETALAAAADIRIFGRDSLAAGRFGVAYTHAEGISREGYAFLAGRVKFWEGRVGVAQAHAYGSRATRLRLAVGLHYARYIVGVAREDNPSGLAPTYQFMLSTLIP